MKLKGKKAVTNKDIDCWAVGFSGPGTFIPSGSYCTIKFVRRVPGYRNPWGGVSRYGGENPQKVAWVEFDSFGQRNVFLEDLEVLTDAVKVIINKTGELKSAEIVEMNCVKVGKDFYQPHEYTFIPDDAEGLKEAIREVSDQQGWTDDSLGVLATEFIGQAKLNARFYYFLKQQAKEEKNCECNEV